MTDLPERLPYADVNNLPGVSAREVVDTFLAVGGPNKAPTAVLLIGPIASGKTTMRHERYGATHVALDPADIYFALTLHETEVTSDIHERLESAGSEVVSRALAEGRDVCFEFTPMGPYCDGELTRLLDALTARGYKIELVTLDCSSQASRERDRARPMTNLSSYWTQLTLLRWMSAALAASPPEGSVL